MESVTLEKRLESEEIKKEKKTIPRFMCLRVMFNILNSCSGSILDYLVQLK